MARSREPRDLSRRHVLIYLGIVLFLAADVGLVALALSSTQAANTTSKIGPIPTFEATAPTPKPTATPVPTSKPTATPEPPAVPPTRLIAALDATTAWRATTGACPATEASPELSIDSGASWKAKDATGPAKVVALQRITVGSAATATMVGLSQSGCAPQLVKTFVAGRNFASYPKELASAWYVDPSTRGSVHSPAGDKKAPCPAVVAIAPSGAKTAAVLCADHSVHSTADSAVTWSAAVSVPGAGNITATAKGLVVSAGADTRCVGVRLVSLALDPLAVTGTACLPLAAAPPAGEVAVTEAADTLWVWAGDSLRRSADGGATWR
jgi:hypothetical protein